MAKHKVKVEFPKFMYGPNGKGKIFNSAEEIPEGWFESKGGVESAPVINQEIKKGPKTAPPAPSKDKDLTPDEMFEFLDSKKMSDLWAMARELELDKGGKKPELIKRIMEKLQSAQA